MQPRRFVISDIHGCCRTFRSLVSEVIKLERADELYLLGDMIDRGPDSKGVLDFFLELRARGFRVNGVMGNHEEMCLLAGESPSMREMWFVNGGMATLRSFAVRSVGDIPEHYLALLRDLPDYIELDDFVIVHAALNFDSSDPFADREAMLWMRDCSVEPSRIGGRRLVSGHTPVTRELLDASLATDRILLDNGCVFSGRSGLGSLTALELNSMKVWYQDSMDR
ncbi:MAG TPA: metallophosphoesterase [Geobacteraceae bacterium]|nr:metallophosphoesterase [Geobacteraceae bacterium]